ncbi:TPA: hypothetical protein ACS5XR_004852, partial [Salmonella enterica]
VHPAKRFIPIDRWLRYVTPRPEVAWRPEHYRRFLRYLIENVIKPEVTVACGHAAGYLLAQAAEHPS